jgi:hypothetical protein
MQAILSTKKELLTDKIRSHTAKVGIAWIDAIRREERKKSTPTFMPLFARVGSSTSSVVPGRIGEQYQSRRDSEIPREDLRHDLLGSANEMAMIRPPGH